MFLYIYNLTRSNQESSIAPTSIDVGQNPKLVVHVLTFQLAFSLSRHFSAPSRQLLEPKMISVERQYPKDGQTKLLLTK